MLLVAGVEAAFFPELGVEIIEPGRRRRPERGIRWVCAEGCHLDLELHLQLTSSVYAHKNHK